MGRVAATLLLVTLLSACEPGPRPDGGASPTPSATTPKKREPRVARFTTGFNVLEASGISCDGLAGPWRVRIEPPDEIDGRDRTTFRLPNVRGPGRLRWSFEASHPGQGVVTYSGNVRVRAIRSSEGTELRFSGTQTSVGAESQVIGSAKVKFGGPCGKP